MHATLRLLSLAAALFATDRATAQTSTVATGQCLDSAHGIVVDEHGTPWALGRGYKARLGDGGIEFTPALGTRAPTNRTLAFHLQSIQCGERTVPLPIAVPSPHVVGNSVSYERGSVSERYECRADGVEQSFVFAERPAGDGDLIVRGAIATNLASIANDGGTLFFHDGRVGGVTLGAVTGIDRDGARCAGTMHFVNGVLELRLPGAFVAAAAFPLVLDPLIGTGFLAGGAATDDDQVEVAYETTMDLYCVVWRRSFSAADQDIQAQRVSPVGSLWGSIVAITLTPTAEAWPQIAAVNARNRFVIAWAWGSSMFGPWALRAASLGSALAGATIDVVGGAISSSPPSLCGDRGTIGTSALLAWASPAYVATRRTLQISSTGAITLGALYTTPAVSASSVKLAKSRLPGSTTVMALIGLTAQAEVIDSDGATVAAPISASFLPRDGFDGDGANFVRIRPTSTGIDLTPITWNGTALVFGATTNYPGAAVNSVTVAWTGERFLVAWEASTSNPFDSELKALSVKPDCSVCSVEFVVPVVARPNQRAPAIGAGYAGGSTAGAALLAWSETATAPPFTSSVVVQRFTAMTGGAPVVLSPSGPGGGDSDTEEPFALGSANFAFRLDNADPTAPIAVLGLSDGSTAPIPCGTTFINALATYAMLMTNGTARQPFPVPCNPLLLGFTLEYQWILVGSSFSPCPPVPGLTAGERRVVTLSL